MARPGWVYLMASAPRGTLYLGVTSNLLNRVLQHRTGHFEGFTSRYDVKRIAWNDSHAAIADAIRREKAMKFWKRAWKIRLIEEHNPHWLDLAVDWGFPPLGD
ncbi:GIY-YIG nuclease family protein [Sandarakinorhabdus sp.]|uniref:GIY-YIG nuclease family protein n=1 Tax=Sandarakinorhabdus sp. TaxID=1916663 RepID=UPI003341E845